MTAPQTTGITDPQAVITALRAERDAAMAREAALAEVLDAINQSPDNPASVFKLILRKSHELCRADIGALVTYDGEVMLSRASLGLPEGWTRTMHAGFAPTAKALRDLICGAQYIHHPDARAAYGGSDDPLERGIIDDLGVQTVLLVALRRHDRFLGFISAHRREMRPYTEREITLLQNFAAQAVIAMENARLLGELHTALDAAQTTLRDLKTAQANLIQAEKMASLGQLTAGIAHEIKNPLNFVNNFAALSVDLLSELKEAAAPGFTALTDDQRAEIDDVSAMLTSNLEKITEHGKRADGIVKAMLEHSRGSSAERRMVDLNALIDEALNLAYHGARAQDQSFNITLERDFGETIVPIEVNPQDMTRVFLNIFSNGLYATTKRARDGGDAGFVPTLKVITRDTGEVVEIRVRDNGTGIPFEIRDKLFQPFFTTKPTGEGTGLGLSITYDIVTKQHGGTIAVESEVGEYSEFTIRLPRNQ